MNEYTLIKWWTLDMLKVYLYSQVFSFTISCLKTEIKGLWTVWTKTVMIMLMMVIFFFKSQKNNRDAHRNLLVMGSVFDLLTLIKDKLLQNSIFIMSNFTNFKCTINKQKLVTHTVWRHPRSKFLIKLIKMSQKKKKKNLCSNSFLT